MTKPYDVLSTELRLTHKSQILKPNFSQGFAVSKNSAFSVFRKRTYEEFKEMDENQVKQIELWEDSNKTRDEGSLSSSLSIKSFYNAEAANHEESKIEDSPTKEAKKRDEKLKTKTSEFRSYHELQMNQRREFYARELKDMNQK